MALIGASLRAAHAAPANKPQWLKLEWGELYLRTDIQYENERQSDGTPNTVFSHKELIVEPAVGVGLNGSVYHPNLMEFHLNAELGVSWEDSQVEPGGVRVRPNFSSGIKARWTCSAQAIRDVVLWLQGHGLPRL